MTTDSSDTVPKTRDVPTLQWLFTPRRYAATIGATALLALAVFTSVLTATTLSPTKTVMNILDHPYAILACLTSGRALGFLIHEHSRTTKYAQDKLSAPNPTPIDVLLITISFSLVGLLAAFIGWPNLYPTSHSITIIAVGVALVAAPISYGLLFHRFGELVAADKYRNEFRIRESVWRFPLLYPFIVTGWMYVFPVSELPVPVNTLITGLGFSALSQEWTTISIWGMLYLALTMPTLLTVAYLGRRIFSVLSNAITVSSS